MTKNTALCAGDNALVYPAPGSPRPHAPVSIVSVRRATRLFVKLAPELSISTVGVLRRG
jgi:hypothetical protein